MSGTSLDGLDIAFCTFYKKEEQNWIYKIIEAECIGYDATWKKKLQEAPYAGGKELILLHKEYGSFLGTRVIQFINKHNVNPDFISSHGHTVFHDPANKLTFQLGDGAALYAAVSIPVICDFRSVDVALGGQGAPLVPIGDALLFGDYDYSLNLGGIANISFTKSGKRIAYDICGCNLLLNYFAREKGIEFDNNGELAKAGEVKDSLLEALNSWDYYQRSAPKSLDKETMLQALLPVINKFPQSVEVILATLTEHIAIQVARATTLSGGKMLITGGGTFNKFLVEKIKKYSTALVHIPDEQTIKYKEALVFAFLGVLRIRNENNSLASVTGASSDNIGGAIFGPVYLK
jgi:anhydro-N-acetylmuramic acid kinase